LSLCDTAIVLSRLFASPAGFVSALTVPFCREQKTGARVCIVSCSFFAILSLFGGYVPFVRTPGIVFSFTRSEIRPPNIFPYTAAFLFSYACSIALLGLLLTLPFFFLSQLSSGKSRIPFLVLHVIFANNLIFFFERPAQPPLLPVATIPPPPAAKCQFLRSTEMISIWTERLLPYRSS